MKAEHRKELQTNALAHAMTKLVKEVRARPQSTAVVGWVLGVLAVVIFVIWLFSGGSNSALWVEIESDSYIREPHIALASLAEIAAKSPKTLPGRTARFQEARLLLPQGLQMLGTADRADALKRVVRARTLFGQLINETSDDPLLRQEALLGAAKAEEALIGVPNPDKADQSYGTVAKALELYNKAAEISPDGYLAKQAQERAKYLQEHGTEVEKFYTEFNKLASAAVPAPANP
jgi:tetratricopeptide (TPR) repeat protein